MLRLIGRWPLIDLNDMPARLTLSLITPVFNTPPDYLAAVAQSLPAAVGRHSYEWIIVDDGSTDGRTRAMLGELATQPEVRLLTNTKTKGAAGARNTGADVSQAPYLVFVDADDLLQSGGIESLLDAITNNPQLRCVVADFEQFEDSPGDVDVAPELLADSECVPVHEPDIARRLIFETLFNQGSYVVERSLFFDLGGFDERFRIGEDWLLWMRLAVRKEIYYCRRLVMWQRRGHASVMSGSLSATQAVVAPYLAARRDTQFVDLKKPLRWRISKLYGLLAQRNADGGSYWNSVRFAMLAALWSVNDLGQWWNAVRVAAGQAPR